MHERRSDAELLRASRGDPAAFLAFYDRYEASVVGHLRRSLRDPEAVADLTAEVFAAALRAAPRYRRSRPTAGGWLITIAHNKLMGSLSKQRVEAKARRRLGIRDAVSFTDEELDRVEALASGDGQLMGLLAELPSDQADAIRARVLDERPYHEIASELRTSELVIRKRVSRGLTTLRHQVEKQENRS
jgi:RNA polymerase sigma factor (sigma-70 family)